MFYSISDIAKEVRVSDRTVRRWIEKDLITYQYFGSLIRIPQEEMERIRKNGLPCHKVISHSHSHSPRKRSRKEERLWVN